MTDRDEPASDALAREALSWLNRLSSGAVTTAEAEAFTTWRAQSPSHDAAFAEAVALQRAVRDTLGLRADTPPHPAPRRSARRRPPHRRAILAGGAAAAAAAAYALAVNPDLLVGGLADLGSDYHTGVGERYVATPASGLSLELNSRTRIAIRRAAAQPEIELLSGEAAATARRASQDAVVLVAGDGRTRLSDGRVNLRKDGAEVCVTCLAGAAEVAHRTGRRRLGPGWQLRYDADDIRPLQRVDAAMVSAWQRDLLIFRDSPLADVVNELNRYRSGRIILLDAAVGRRPVYAAFRISRIDESIDQISDLTGAAIVRLPGGVVLLG